MAKQHRVTDRTEEYRTDEQACQPQDVVTEAFAVLGGKGRKYHTDESHTGGEYIEFRIPAREASNREHGKCD